MHDWNRYDKQQVAEPAPERRSMLKVFTTRYRTTLTVFGSALLGMLLVLIYLQLNPQEGRYSDADIRRLAQERIDAITPSPPLEPEIYAMVRPSVVLITNGPVDSRESGIGSGVVVDLNGSILTAYHVVAGSDVVNVRFYDGTIVTGTVSQVQPDRDLATVQVRRLPNGVGPATLAGGVRQGDQVMAIGSPFGLDGSVSSGVVSAIGRSFTVEATGQILSNMIQFDAAVNPGNSGGPLVDLNGRVVGIVTGLINPTNDRTFIGLGFAVPIEAASGIFAPLG
jgi:S1-C subfamily serine protease